MIQPGRSGQIGSAFCTGSQAAEMEIQPIPSNKHVPLRLFVCLGFCGTVAICLVFLGGEAVFGFPAGAGSGESRIVEGDGILISSIPERCSRRGIMWQGKRGRAEVYDSKGGGKIGKIRRMTSA